MFWQKKKIKVEEPAVKKEPTLSELIRKADDSVFEKLMKEENLMLRALKINEEVRYNPSPYAIQHYRMNRHYSELVEERNRIVKELQPKLQNKMYCELTALEVEFIKTFPY